MTIPDLIGPNFWRRATIMSKQTRLVLSVLLIAMFGASLTYAAIMWATSIPIVAYSITNQECAWVLPVTAGTCDNLPIVYDRVWVK